MLSTLHEHPIQSFLLSLVIVALIIFLGAKTYQALSPHPLPTEHTIFIEGIGKATMVPNVAVMNFTVYTKAASVAEAQKENSAKMNNIIDKFKKAGIDSKDLQTRDYTAGEVFEWNKEKETNISVGWNIKQRIEVKIRDTEKISTIIEIAGQNGSNGIDGPTFQVDDSTVYEATARMKALEDARQKADTVAKSLGLRIAKVIGYSEWKEDPSSNPTYRYSDMGGMGGAGPNIETGTQELKLHTTVTYLLED